MEDEWCKQENGKHGSLQVFGNNRQQIIRMVRYLVIFVELAIAIFTTTAQHVAGHIKQIKLGSSVHAREGGCILGQDGQNMSYLTVDLAGQTSAETVDSASNVRDAHHGYRHCPDAEGFESQ